MSTFKYKAIILGDSGVGKTTFLRFLLDDVYQDNGASTIGATYDKKRIQMNKSSVIDITLWDTAGQERFRSLSPMYSRDAHFAFIFYDSSREDTLKSWKEWFDIVVNQNENCKLDKGEPGRTTFILIATKIDIRTQMKETTAAEFEKIKDYFDGYFETSSKNNTGFDQFNEFLEKKAIEKVLNEQKKTNSSKGAFSSPFALSEIKTFDTKSINRLTHKNSNKADSKNSTFSATPLAQEDNLLNELVNLKQSHDEIAQKKKNCAC